jgi:hypothetical protein
VVKRAGKTVEPDTRTIDGTSGNFIFGFPPFAPTATITLDLVGKTRTQSCVFDRTALSRLRWISYSAAGRLRWSWLPVFRPASRSTDCHSGCMWQNRVRRAKGFELPGLSTLSDYPDDGASRRERLATRPTGLKTGSHEKPTVNLRRGARVRGGMRIAALMATLALLAIGAPRAQAPAAQAPAFDVASVKPNKDGGPSSVRVTAGGMLTITNSNLRNIIRNAWNITNDQIVGGPEWIDSDRFDITAKASQPFGQDQARAMLQALLADRFGLATHDETREVPVYLLVLAAQGRQPRPADEEGRR